MLYNRCRGIYKFGNNTYPRRIRRRLNLGHIYRGKKKCVLWARKYGTSKKDTLWTTKSSKIWHSHSSVQNQVFRDMMSCQLRNCDWHFGNFCLQFQELSILLKLRKPWWWWEQYPLTKSNFLQKQSILSQKTGVYKNRLVCVYISSLFHTETLGQQLWHICK